MKNVINLLDRSDARIETLYLALKEVMLERSIGLPVATVIGTLDLLIDEVKRIALDE